jgi:hypothetical protein
MSVAQMSCDIRLLCPRCKSVMVPVQLSGTTDDDRALSHAFGCQLCRLYYNHIHGYFSVEDSRICMIRHQKIRCPHDGAPMYLESISADGETGIYKCAQFECSGSEIVSLAATYTK